MTRKTERNVYEGLYFPSLDGLRMSADLYSVEQQKGFILLCHRSHCNRGEYRETAPKFNKLGFSCLAIDQRSGMKVFGVINETSALAKPTFVTSPKKEINDVQQILKYMDPKHVVQFKPKVEGFHGSKTLWESVEGHESYWEHLQHFFKHQHGRLNT